MNIKQICEKQIRNVEKSLNLVDLNILEEIAHQINKCDGTLFVCGIGKNGHVAAKTASTFASIGIKSCFLNPVEAVHGDMGNIEQKDIILNISKSGNTAELLNFLNNLKLVNSKVKIISIHSNNNGKTKQLSDYDIYVPEIEEIDKFDIVPTTSISAYTVLVQSLGIYVSNLRNFTLKQFKKNHPGGSIGKQLENE